MPSIMHRIMIASYFTYSELLSLFKSIVKSMKDEGVPKEQIPYVTYYELSQYYF